MLLEKARINGEIKGLRIRREGPVVSHLFFADDSLLFTKANLAEGGRVKGILHSYEKASRQQVNFQKSTILYGRNVGNETRREICRLLDMPKS